MTTPSVPDGTSVPSLVPATRPAFPFTALVGQPQLQRALLLAAIDPGIGGVLISGPRGTAKSTAARALAALLPHAPFVTLPLSASLEQLVGTLNVEDALREGRLSLTPGLLARAHGGVLYVDEVNLLPDALVDALLDAAASGVNTIERDGLSRQHAARFVLVGTMNPEEGELRPQLLDRFGLSVALDNPTDAAQRLAILRARLDFDAAPDRQAAHHAPELSRLAAALCAARERLPHLEWSDEVLHRAAVLALEAGVDGLRADLVMLRAARALAALEGRAAVEPSDVDAVAGLALGHRRAAGAPTVRELPRDKPPAQRPPRQPVAPSAQHPGAASMSQDAAHGEPSSEARRAGDGKGGEGPQAAAPGGDWGALPPQTTGLQRVASVEGWPSKKA